MPDCNFSIFYYLELIYHFVLLTASCLSPVKKAPKLEEKNNEGNKQTCVFNS